MTPNQKIAFHTLGCKLNFSETSTIVRKMEEQGFLNVPFREAADVYVINTCSVTDHADRKCKKIVRQALSANPEAHIVVIGCYAQLRPKEIAEIEGVDLVLGAHEKFNLHEHLLKLEKGQKTKVLQGHIKDVKTFNSSYSLGDRTRSFLKVQDGCNYFCSFCTIPLARGVSRSDYIENIVASAREIAEAGVKEIVLTGVNIGDFSNDRGETFYDLIVALEEQVEGIERIRISSIEPNLLEDRIIDHVADSNKFVPHFHIPLQSGSDYILEKMRRRYRRSLYAERVERIKEKMPHCCIGVDVLTGYPEEDEARFLESYNFLSSLDITYIHPFPYSERPGTPAALRENQVPSGIRTERRKMLQILSHKKQNAFYQQFEGETMEVLFESENKEGYIHGWTANYLRVATKWDEALVNNLVPAKLVEQGEAGYVGVCNTVVT